MTVADFDYVRHYVREQAAIVLEPGKEYLVEARLQSLARKENFASLDELLAKMRNDPHKDIHRKIVDAMTTNETSFFRDIHPFEALRKTVIPSLMQRHGKDRKLNFWCGAASTGQEPYSVMMLIAQHFPELLKWDIKFIATDLSSDVLAQARSGLYSQLEVNRGLPATLLIKNFVRKGTHWEIREELRSLIDFRQMNLVKEWSLLPPLDLIFLRNVMIYFDADAKRTILGKIRRLLQPGGYLLLGGAENIMNIDDGFERVTIDNTPFFQLKGGK